MGHGYCQSKSHSLMTYQSPPTYILIQSGDDESPYVVFLLGSSQWPHIRGHSSKPLTYSGYYQGRTWPTAVSAVWHKGIRCHDWAKRQSLVWVICPTKTLLYVSPRPMRSPPHCVPASILTSHTTAGTPPVPQPLASLPHYPRIRLNISEDLPVLLNLVRCQFLCQQK
jgi:hypothetical protein